MKENVMATTKKSRGKGRVSTARTRDPRALVREAWKATADVRDALSTFRTQVRRQQRQAARELDARLGQLQARAEKERRHAAKLFHQTVRRALIVLDIPSRAEVADLTGKVADLSRKIDGYRRAGARPRRARSVATAH
jgi:hypothetical protein